MRTTNEVLDFPESFFLQKDREIVDLLAILNEQVDLLSRQNKLLQGKLRGIEMQMEQIGRLAQGLTLLGCPGPIPGKA